MVLGFVWVILAWTDVINFPLADWIGWIGWIVGGYFVHIYNGLEDKSVSLFKLLVAVAYADRKFTETEAAQLAVYAKQCGIEGKRMEAIIKNMEENGVQFQIPEEMNEREKNIKSLVKLATADGNVDLEELALIKEVSKKYGLGENFVDSLV